MSHVCSFKHIYTAGFVHIFLWNAVPTVRNTYSSVSVHLACGAESTQTHAAGHPSGPAEGAAIQGDPQEPGSSCTIAEESDCGEWAQWDKGESLVNHVRNLTVSLASLLLTLHQVNNVRDLTVSLPSLLLALHQVRDDCYYSITFACFVPDQSY